MTSHRITCITKSSPHGGCEHITHAGNPGEGWMWTVERIIQAIDAKTHAFFVRDDRTGRSAWVGVMRQNGRRPYIRTYADGVWNDNLLSLNACPWGLAA